MKRAPALANVPVAAALTAVAAVLVLAVEARRSELAPSSIWFDDAWVAAVSRLGWRDVPEVGLTSPGFVGLQWFLFRLFGFSELRAQLVPFAAGIVSPAALVIMSLWRRIPLPAAAGAGIWLAWAPAHVDYSSRVKQYTLDSVLAIALLGAAWWVLDEPTSRRRWGLLGVFAIAASATSASIVPVVAASLGAASLAALFRGWQAIVPALATGAIYSVALGIWWRLVIEPATQEGLWAYWSGFYTAPTDGLSGWASAVWARLWDLVEWLSPFGTGPTIAAIALAFVVLLIRQPLIAVLTGGPVLIAIVLSSLAIVPLGTGRTDIYLYPSMIMAVAAAIPTLVDETRTLTGRLGRSWPEQTAPLALGLTLVVFIAAFVVRDDRRATPYPVEDLRPMVEHLEATRSPDEPVLVYPSARYAYAIYTSSQVVLSEPSRHLVFSPYSVNIGDPKLTILEPHRHDPENYRPQMEIAADGAPKIWFVASHQSPADLPVIMEHFAAMGYTQLEILTRDGAELSLWEKTS